MALNLFKTRTERESTLLLLLLVSTMDQVLILKQTYKLLLCCFDIFFQTKKIEILTQKIP